MFHPFAGVLLSLSIQVRSEVVKRTLTFRVSERITATLSGGIGKGEPAITWGVLPTAKPTALASTVKGVAWGGMIQ